MNSHRKRIAVLEKELKGQMIEVFLPDQDNILTDIDELLELHHEIIKAGREKREIEHSLIDKGILKATGVSTDTSLVKLFIELVKAGDRY